jgi:hypothetical protein
MSADAIGARYGVHANNIYFIWNGKTFRSTTSDLGRDAS